MKKGTWLFSCILILSFLSTSYSSDTNRPKVGLVLSGGGAKGFAHIGTLKMLDSLQIPIDYIVGTSIGGIVGALYSIGYNGLDLEEIVTQEDWLQIFTDKPPRIALPYFPKKETGKYQVEFGFEQFKPTAPSGLIFGQKISLLFSSLTFPYEKFRNFDQLPIPFRCVAVDLVTGNQVILKDGSLAKAMRATMAIPTVFSPVEWGDSLLVDGGIANNLPVDVAKEIGADIVIAIDVGAALLERKELNSVLAVLNQSLRMVGLEQWKKNIREADILIRPDIAEYSTSDFDSKKIKNIIRQGDLAAYRSLEQFLELKQKYKLTKLENPETISFLSKQPRIYSIQITGHTSIPFQYIYEKLNLASEDFFDPFILKQQIAQIKSTGLVESIDYKIVPVNDEYVRLFIQVKEKQKPVIHGISIDGNKTLPFTFVYNLLGLKPGMRLNTEDLNSRIMEMYGLAYFEHIQYEIIPEREGSIHLKLIVKELPNRRLRIGLRYDDYRKLVAAVSVNGSNFILPGVRYQHDLQFAGLFSYQFKAYYPSRTLNLPIYPFLRYNYKDIPINIFDAFAGLRVANYKDKSASFGMGFGLLITKSFNAEVEYQQEEIDVKPSIALSDPDMFPSWKDKLLKINFSLDFDLLDDVLLPRNGLLINATYEWSSKEINSDINYSVAKISADYYQTFSRRHTTRLYAFWGSCTTAPVYKYINQGNPNTFVGLEYDQLFASKMSILRFDYRYQYSNSLFLKLITNVAFDLEYQDPVQLVKVPSVWGYGIGLKLLSPVGPIEIIYSLGQKNFIGERKKQDLVYFRLGYKF